jgi:hypothetical protein
MIRLIKQGSSECQIVLEADCETLAPSLSFLHARAPYTDLPDDAIDDDD